MRLYVCPIGPRFGALPGIGALPGPVAHPCGRASHALDQAGHAYEVVTVQGGSLKPWTWPRRARDRAEVKRLSGQRAVPILVLDDGEVIAGSGAISAWAAAHPAS